MPFSNIDKPSKYFDITLFTGDNASGRTFTGLNFAPDMIWGKSKDTANLNHQIVDIVRGGTKFIFTNSTVAEDTASHGQITSWNSDGTTWADGTNGTYPRLYYNDNGQLGGAGSRVWWQWKANGAGVSNTAGTITSTVSASQTSGFSIVSWVGNQTAGASCGHGLGVAPSMIIKRRRDGDGADYWYVYHKSLGNSNSIYLNTTDASGASGAWNSQTPTSTVFYHGSSIRENGNNMIAYCFAEVKGFSKAFSYTGNGSSDGPFTYCGFKPKFLLIKKTDSTSNWTIRDTARDTYNVSNKGLFANNANAEGTEADIDILSNGFKCRQAGGDGTNASGGSYIGFAISENPFVSSKGIAVTAR